ncbi:coenzyme PQQ biosynthesis protein PqqF [compost metagenome]
MTLCLDTEGSDWTLALRGPGDCLSSTLVQALSVLRHPSPAVLDQGARLQGVEQQRAAAEIPIRQLLDALPRAMAGLHATPLDWDSAQWDALTLNAQLPEPEQVPGRPATHCLLPPALPGGRHSRSWAGEGDAALLLFCPMASQQAADEAAWRMLARVLEVGFFGRMRGELNLGYALFCGFRQVAGWRGILFAVQSPQVEPDLLLRHVEDFLSDVVGQLKDLSGERLQALGQGMAEPLLDRMAGGGSRVEAAWKDHLAGVDALHSQRLSEAACRLTRNDILAAHASLLAEQGGWWLLANRPGFNSAPP